jgi:hypothetical protein
MRIVGLYPEKASPQSRVLKLSPAAPNVPARNRAESKGAYETEQSSAFASNKGTLRVHESSEVAGQQLAAGEYQLRWDGTGSNVEVRVMQGKKEVAKTSAKFVNLDKASDYDAAIVDHSSGKAIVTEVRFAGKKYALALVATEKAEMSEGSNK